MNLTEQRTIPGHVFSLAKVGDREGPRLRFFMKSLNSMVVFGYSSHKRW